VLGRIAAQDTHFNSQKTELLVVCFEVEGNEIRNSYFMERINKLECHVSSVGRLYAS